MVTLTKHVIFGPDLPCADSLHFEDFCNIFLPNISEDQKKSYYLSAGLSTVPYGKYGAGYCIMFIKSLGEGLRYQLLEQKPLISPWL